MVYVTQITKWNKDFFIELGNKILEFIPNLIFGVIVFLFFWWLSKRVNNFIIRIGEYREVSPALLSFLGRFAAFITFSVGTIASLATVGIDVTTLTASLGLTGFALGFALKDTISNLIAGIMVIFYKTFRKGDFIDVAGVQGNVVEVNLRYTVLNMMDGKIAFIPNSTMFTRHIIVTKELSISNVDDEDDGYNI